MPLHFNPAHFNSSHFAASFPVNTAFGRQLIKSGSPVEILRSVVTGYDNFGNPIVGYEHLCFAYAILMAQREDERFLISGTTERADAVGFFEADVEVTKGCKVSTACGAYYGNWQVLYVDQKVKGGKVHHIKALLRRLEAEG